MTQIRTLYHIAHADFLERVRRYGFLVTLASALFIGYAAFSGRIVLKLGNYAGVLNSAWIGAMMAMVSGTFLSLVGFYIVRDSVSRDQNTRVGRVLASTPMSKWSYVLGKTLSNLAILLTMVLVLVVCAIVMELFKGQAEIHLWKITSPFLLFVVPAMVVTAALAVFFEVAPGLRGGAGNVIYFFVWTVLLSTEVSGIVPTLTGVRAYMSSMGEVVRRVDPNWTESFTLSLGGKVANNTFLWNGLDWTWALVTGRFVWLAFALVLCFGAAIFFHRFDPARERLPRKQRKQTTLENTIKIRPTRQAHHMPMASTSMPRFAVLVISEIKLLLKGQRKWWYVIALGIAVAGALSPPHSSAWLLLAAAIWPVLIWSQMGTRESLFNTRGLIFSCPEPVFRQLPASWTAGIIVSGLLLGGPALQMLVAGDFAGIVTWLAAIVFIPSLALALGTITGNRKVFEALYTVWWYIGPAHQLPQFDFLGTVSRSRSPVLYFLLAAVLFGTAFLARRKSVAYS